MKMNKLYKSARSFFAASAICAAMFTTVACSNLVQKNENDIEQQLVQINGTKPVISIRFNDSERTVFPGCAVSDLQDFSLTIKKGTADAVALGESSYATAAALQSASIALDETYIDSTCTFTLTAKTASDVVFEGSVSTKVMAGENTVIFRLSPKLSGEAGTNSFALTLDYSTDTANASKVTKAVANLYSLPGNTTSDSSNTTTVVTGYENVALTPAQNKVTFSGTALDSGSYRADIKLYGGANGDIFVAQWIEVIQIAKELPSNATRTISSLNDLFTVTYHYNAEGSTTLTDGTTATLSATSVSALQVPTREGYLFIDWYTDAELTQIFNLKDINADVDLYAKWLDLSAYSDTNYVTKHTIVAAINNAADTTIDSPCVIKLVGNVDTEVFTEIKNTMEDNTNSSKYFSIDLSALTDLTELPSSAFYNCRGLVSIELPEGLKYIRGQAFNYCGNLQSISIPSSVTSVSGSAFVFTISLSAFTVDENNKYYKAIDGVLYSKDGTKLISYPASKTDYRFTIPSSVTTIGSYAFSRPQDLRFLNIGTNVNNLESSAFYRCSGISYNFSDTQSIWYIGSKEDAEQYGKVIFNILNESSRWSLSYPSSMTKANGVTMSDFIAQRKPSSLNVYRDESMDLSKNFTFAEFESYDSAKWYSFTTIQNSEYSIMLCDGSSKSNFVLGTNTGFVSTTVTCYDSYGNELTNSFSNGVLKFTANTSKVYVVVRPSYSSNSGKCALRVVRLPDADLNLTVQVLSVDNELNYTLGRDGTLKFAVADAGDSYTWFVDNASTTITTKTFDFDPGYYTKGIHVVSVLIKDGTKYYSRTAQIMVQ